MNSKKYSLVIYDTVKTCHKDSPWSPNKCGVRYWLDCSNVLVSERNSRDSSFKTSRNQRTLQRRNLEYEIKLKIFEWCILWNNGLGSTHFLSCLIPVAFTEIRYWHNYFYLQRMYTDKYLVPLLSSPIQNKHKETCFDRLVLWKVVAICYVHIQNNMQQFAGSQELT